MHACEPAIIYNVLHARRSRRARMFLNFPAANWQIDWSEHGTDKQIPYRQLSTCACGFPVLARHSCRRELTNTYMYITRTTWGVLTLNDNSHACFRFSAYEQETTEMPKPSASVSTKSSAAVQVKLTRPTQTQQCPGWGSGEK